MTLPGLFLLLLPQASHASPPQPPPVSAEYERCMAQDACRELLRWEATTHPPRSLTVRASGPVLPPVIWGFLRRDFSAELEGSLWLLAPQESPAATAP